MPAPPAPETDASLASSARQRLVATLVMCASTICFSLTDVLAKWLSAHYTVPQIVFCRGLFALVPVMILAAHHGLIPSLATRRPYAHMLRAVFAMLSLIAVFYAYSLMPLADATAISFTTPLFVALMSAPFLAERVAVRTWIAVACGFIGVLIIVRPSWQSLGGSGWATPIALVGAACSAAGAIVIREMSGTEKSVTVVFYQSLVVAACMATTLPFLWIWPTSGDWMLLVAAGISGGTGQLLMTEAIRRAPAALVYPFDYLRVLWATVFGYAIFSDVPDLLLVVGTTIVIASVLSMFERRPVPAGTRRG
ncbi:MAG: DMT family transporter [Alphaproteobacteria bacterium]|nr:DMT family transporter [Alphaproteobacteria bacterium]